MILLCQNCQKSFVSRSKNGKYCSSCREIVIKRRKFEYYYRTKDNPLVKKRNHAIQTKTRKRKKEQLIANGLKIAQQAVQSSVAWKQEFPDPNFNVLLTIAIPFDWSLSKNRMKNYGGGHYYLNPDTATAKREIINKIQQSSTQWIQSKVYLELFVEKPNQRGDAINFIDTIADAVVKAIGVDDRWFSIGKVDWQINKINPRIYITIKQDTTNPLQACSHCGRLLTFDNFHKNKSTKNGIGRSCIDCRTIK